MKEKKEIEIEIERNAPGHELDLGVNTLSLGATSKVIRPPLHGVNCLGWEGQRLLAALLPLAREVVGEDAAGLPRVDLGDHGPFIGIHLQHALLELLDGKSLVRGDKPGAHPHPVSTQGKRGCHSPPVKDSAGSHHRNLVPDGIHGLGKEGHETQQPSVASTLRPLHNNKVAAVLNSPLDMRQLAADGPNHHAMLVALVHDTRGHPEASDEGLDPGLDADSHILIQVLFVVLGERGQEIHPKGLGRQLLGLKDLLVKLVRSEIPRPNGPETVKR